MAGPGAAYSGHIRCPPANIVNGLETLNSDASRNGHSS